MTRRIVGKLPKGWEVGRSIRVIAKVRMIERYSDAGLYRYADTQPDAKGYRWAALCVGHPFANTRGVQRLHRYLLMRALGEVLPWYMHGHHLPGASKATEDIHDLEAMEATDHGRYHYGKRLGCNGHLPAWRGRDESGAPSEPPTAEGMAASIEVAASGGPPPDRFGLTAG